MILSFIKISQRDKSSFKSDQLGVHAWYMYKTSGAKKQIRGKNFSSTYIIYSLREVEENIASSLRKRLKFSSINQKKYRAA